jgi:hypothetical protein
MSGPSLSELKTYIGVTTSTDDALLTTALASAIGQAERDTGRTFSVASNVTADYSSDAQVLVHIADIPRSDSSRVVTLSGAALTEGTGYWLLPDRRYPDISTTIQLFHFDQSRGDWYKADPMWWDKNLDTFWRRGSTPNDLRIVSVQGHPVWRADVTEQVLFLGAWFYWRAKSGASGVVQLPNGTEVDLGAEPLSTPQFIRNWSVRTAVAGV